MLHQYLPQRDSDIFDQDWYPPQVLPRLHCPLYPMPELLLGYSQNQIL